MDKKVSIPDGLEKELAKVRAVLSGPHGGEVWDVITATRGPDFPSERPNMPASEAEKAYRGRRERKYRTGEVIRAVAFPGCCPGARTHYDDHVTLPPKDEWDHYDKHVSRAANVLGLKVEIMPKREVKGEIKAKLIDPKKEFDEKVKEILKGNEDLIIEFDNKVGEVDDDGDPLLSTLRLYRSLDKKVQATLQERLYHTGSPLSVVWERNPKLPVTPEWKLKAIMDYYQLTGKSGMSYAQSLVDNGHGFPAALRVILRGSEPKEK